MEPTQKSHLTVSPLSALQLAAECLKVLAHPHRIRIVQLLLQKQLTVGELARACQIPSHMTSEHLRLMQRCGLLRSEREGRCKFYFVADVHLENLMQCIEQRFGTKRVASINDLTD